MSLVLQHSEESGKQWQIISYYVCDVLQVAILDRVIKMLNYRQLALTKRKEVYTDMFYGLIMTEMLKNCVNKKNVAKSTEKTACVIKQSESHLFFRWKKKSIGIQYELKQETKCSSFDTIFYSFYTFSCKIFTSEKKNYL